MFYLGCPKTTRVDAMGLTSCWTIEPIYILKILFVLLLSKEIFKKFVFIIESSNIDKFVNYILTWDCGLKTIKFKQYLLIIQYSMRCPTIHLMRDFRGKISKLSTSIFHFQAEKVPAINSVLPWFFGVTRIWTELSEIVSKIDERHYL